MIRLALAIALAAPAAAQDVSPGVQAFVQGNALSIFYHELGHALVDLEEVPIFGQEEDAADVFSVVMTVEVFDENHVNDLAYDYALGFDFEARLTGEDVAWWDAHGPDEQRFYNTVCLFYGAYPDALSDYAEDMGLPEDRADYCPEEFDQAEAAWGGIIDDLVARGGGDSLVYTGPDDGLIGTILAGEVAALNAELSLSNPLTVSLAPCGEANAFYDPQDASITFCTEFEAHLIEAGRTVLQ